jgi:ATP-binding cassette subfamily F protein 3
LIFVSHDRYFVDRLATKIIAVGHGAIEVYPGTYEQFLWSRTQRAAQPAPALSKPAARKQSGNGATPQAPARGKSGPQPPPTTPSHPHL